MAGTTVTPPEPPAELRRVIDWRAAELRRAGFPEELAERIAQRPDIDLHHAVELVVRGCPPETAGRILL